MASFEAALARLDAYAERQLRARATPGMTVGLTDRERLLGVRTYGYANVDSRQPVAPETLFEIGSIGKSFTSIALMQLREEGLFDPQAPITDYLPWWRVQSRHAPIRCHHLLSHTAGLITGSDFSPDQRFEAWALRDSEASTPPGERFHYSNIGYKTLGMALEAITGRAWAAVVRDGILDPLGMRDTDPRITHETRKRLAQPYRRFYDDRPGHPSQPLVPAPWLETDTGDGCVSSTAADMAAYLRMLLNRGRGPGGRLISEESFDLLTQRVSARRVGDGPEMHYGYGLMTWEEGGHAFLGHSGGMVGYSAQMTGDQTAGLGVFVAINGPGNAREVAAYALQLLTAAANDQSLPDPPPTGDPARIPDAADYAGVYRGGADGDLTLVAEGDRLAIEQAGERIPLEERGADTFVTPHPAFDRFPLVVARDAAGRVVELSHGPRWRVCAAYAGPTTFDYPAEWEAFAGHYRSHNPWSPNFRVLLRKGQLFIAWPAEPDGFNPEDVLTPLPDGSFRVSDDPGNPERVRFDTVVNGEAWRAHVSGCEYYRFFTE